MPNKNAVRDKNEKKRKTNINRDDDHHTHSKKIMVFVH